MTESKKPRHRAKGAGRPPKPAGERLELVPIRFPPALLERVDALCDAARDGGDRSKMIRELVGEALDRRERSKQRARK